MRRYAILLLGAFASITEARTVAPVVARLVVPSTSILPGVPFDMWIEMTNTLDSAVRVAVNPLMKIYPVDGMVTYKCNAGCFEWQNRKWSRAKRVENQDIARIPAGGKTTYRMTIGPPLTAPEIEDEISLSKLAGHRCAMSVQIKVLEPAIDTPLITNEVEI